MYEKFEMIKFGTKNELLWHFWVRILKKYFLVWNDHPRFCQSTKFCKKMSLPKFGTKKMLSWGVVRPELLNINFICKRSTLDFAKLLNLAKKFKFLNSGAKMPYLGILQLKCEKKKKIIAIYEISTLKFV